MSKKYLGLLLICSAALVACGKPEAPAAIATPAVTTPAVVATAAAPEADNAVGKSVFGKTCAHERSRHLLHGGIRQRRPQMQACYHQRNGGKQATTPGIWSLKRHRE